VIIRVLNAWVQAGRVAQFNAIMRRQTETLASQPGIRYVRLARRLEPDGGEEVLLFEEWSDADSLYAWVGADLTRPRLEAAAEEAITRITVSHFEVLDAPIATLEERPDHAQTG